MPTFVAVYRGPTISEARLVTASADPQLVADVVARLLSDALTERTDDPAVASVAAGRRQALRVIAGELDGEGAS